VLRHFIDDPSLAARMGESAAESISEFSFERNVEGLRQALRVSVAGFSS
jgi:hypothetical protein